MEDITSSFAGGFAVSENNVHDQHPRFSNFKNESKISESQRSRRQAILEPRNERVDRLRALFLANEPGLISTSPNDITMNNNENMDFNISPQVTTRNPRKRTEFSNILMHSEWLVDIPCDLDSEWIMVPVPEGKRCLASTVIYSKTGYRLNQFQSDLPGGSRFNSAGITMLDCIVIKDEKKIYVLDILCWGDSQYLDTEFSCRNYILQSNFEENPSLNENSRFTFHILPSCKCNTEDMEKLLETEFEFSLDGLLFYLSNGHYHAGMTPLVGWLKPWMLPEILKVKVPLNFMYEQKFYQSSQHFIESYNQTHNFKSSIKKNENGENSGEVMT